MPAQTLAVRLLGPEEWTDWEQAAGRCPWRNFFSTRLWIEAYPQAWGELRVVGVFRGGELAGGATLALRRRLWQRVWTTHPMTAYAGYWVAEPPGATPSRLESLHDAAAEALDRFLAGQADEGLLRLDPRAPAARPFLRRGWEATVQHTYLTEIGSADEPEETFENDARRQIAKARKAGIVVREDEDWAGFSARAQGTLERKSLSGPYPPGFMERLGQALQSRERGTLLSAFSPEGRPLASAVVAWEGDWATFLYGASAEEAGGTGAPSLLQAEILAYLRRRGGIRVYDWHGANSPAVSRFKKNFNPRLVSYMVLRKSYGLPLGLARAASDAVRRWRTSRRANEP